MEGVTDGNIKQTLEVLAIEIYVRKQKIYHISLDPRNKKIEISNLNKEIEVLNEAFDILDRKE